MITIHGKLNANKADLPSRKLRRMGQAPSASARLCGLLSLKVRKFPSATYAFLQNGQVIPLRMVLK
jgi:hypothetical protein